MRKVVLIGSGGSGKSTLATALGEKTGFPVYHLDKLFWKPNWQESSKDEFRQKLAEIYPLDAWIMDGNFGGTMAERLIQADTIIFLDVSTFVCIISVLKRFLTYRRTNRPDMTEGNNERLDIDFLSWIIHYRRRSRPKVLAMIKEIGKDKNIVILKSRSQMKEYLDCVDEGQLTCG